MVNLTKKESISSVDVLLKLLDEVNFYKELDLIFSCLYIKSTFSYNNMFPIQDKGKFKYWKTIEEILTPQSTFRSNLSENNIVPLIVTPSFIKALTGFLYNLVQLAEEHVICCLQENGLVKMCLRCIYF